jgi:hypothetical protein
VSYSYEDALARRVAAGAPLGLQGGSGYFAPRGGGLDPSLFEQGDHLRPEVRHLILSTLHRFWEKRYHASPEWATLWIAGSGITSAWNAVREDAGAPGDLDVLIGVDYPAFFRWNGAFQGHSEKVLAKHFNQELHDLLWPSMAHARINGSVYEVTYYVNPGGSDIRALNPYAAYDVTYDEWTVHPVHVPAGFDESYFDDDARALVARDAERGQQLVEAYNAQVSAMSEHRNDYARLLNHTVALHQTVRDGAALFDDIHDARRNAFQPDGRGYFDPANYRWQAGKGNGIVGAMRKLKQLDEEAHRDIGGVCHDTGHLLLLASLANGRGR